MKRSPIRILLVLVAQYDLEHGENNQRKIIEDNTKKLTKDLGKEQ